MIWAICASSARHRCRSGAAAAGSATACRHWPGRVAKPVRSDRLPSPSAPADRDPNAGRNNAAGCSFRCAASAAAGRPRGSGSSKRTVRPANRRGLGWSGRPGRSPACRRPSKRPRRRFSGSPRDRRCSGRRRAPRPGISGRRSDDRRRRRDKSAAISSGCTAGRLRCGSNRERPEIRRRARADRRPTRRCNERSESFPPDRPAPPAFPKTAGCRAPGAASSRRWPAERRPPPALLRRCRRGSNGRQREQENPR